MTSQVSAATHRRGRPPGFRATKRMEDARNGDSAAFEEVKVAYRYRIYKAALAAVSDPETARALTDATLETAKATIASYDGSQVLLYWFEAILFTKLREAGHVPAETYRTPRTAPLPPVGHVGDLQLLRRAQGGCEASFVRLARRHWFRFVNIAAHVGITGRAADNMIFAAVEAAYVERLSYDPADPPLYWLKKFLFEKLRAARAAR